LGFAGKRRSDRAEGLFPAYQSLLKFAQNLIAMEGNRFILWQPALAGILTRIADGVRMDAHFPVVKGMVGTGGARKVIVFYLGGVTYEEARVPYEAATKVEGPSLDVIVGGTTVHNSDSFVHRELNQE
jgi:hypothetical protein